MRQADPPFSPDWIDRLKAQVTNLAELPAPILGGLIAGAVMVLESWGALNGLEWQAYQVLHNLHAELGLARSWDDRLALIAIDEKSLQAYGQFNTWSRNYYTDLLTQLDATPPAAIGFDLILSDSTAEDQTFADAIFLNGSTVLATATDSQGNDLSPTEPLAASAAGIGHVLHSSDGDGLTRRVWLHVPTADDRFMPHFSLALAEIYNFTSGTPDPLPLPPPQAGGLAQNTALIHWPAPPSQLPTYSFVDVVEGGIPRETFRDKIVLVGITAVGFDALRTPFYREPLSSGVYLYGVTLQNFLHNSFLKQPPVWAKGVGLLLLGSVGGLVLKRVSTQGQILILAIGPLGWVGITAIALYWHWWLPLASPVTTLFAMTLGVQLRERQEKKMLMYLFSQHVAPETAKLIWQQRSAIFQGGELQAQEMEATVLFMDIRNFTTISEGTPPTQLLHWLNRYLEAMTDCIMDQGGVVDKYIGDAIMAVFGIPMPRTSQTEIQQDACNAIEASLAMYDRLQALNQEFAAEDLPLVRFGIGIHTGRVVAGTVGSSRRLNYSVLGDTVNVAARIEALNKNQQQHNPFDLLISGRTFAYIRDFYDAKQLDAIKLKGKAKATLIYAVQGKRTAQSLPVVQPLPPWPQLPQPISTTISQAAARSPSPPKPRQPPSSKRN